MNLILAGAVMGLGATVLMDLWTLFLWRAAGLPLPNWAMVGRWVAHLGRGRVFHDAIADAEPVPGELRIGWLFHYAVGLVYGVAFVLLAGPDWLAAPSLFPAWAFGIVTIAAGWFLLHPGLGLGWALAATPAPWKARGLGLAGHTVFGAGLWAVALAL